MSDLRMPSEEYPTQEALQRAREAHRAVARRASHVCQLAQEIYVTSFGGQRVMTPDTAFAKAREFVRFAENTQESKDVAKTDY